MIQFYLLRMARFMNRWIRTVKWRLLDQIMMLNWSILKTAIILKPFEQKWDGGREANINI